MTTHPWDLFLVVFHELHRGGHILWPSDDSISPQSLLDVYRAVDRALGEILSCVQVEQTVVAVFALHGMGTYNSQEHFPRKIVDRVSDRFIAGKTSSLSRAPSRRYNPIAALRELIPPRLQSAIALSVPRWARDLVVDRSVTDGHDWKHTPAIALRSDRNGYIRLNIRGRE